LADATATGGVAEGGFAVTDGAVAETGFAMTDGAAAETGFAATGVVAGGFVAAGAAGMSGFAAAGGATDAGFGAAGCGFGTTGAAAGAGFAAAGGATDAGFGTVGGATGRGGWADGGIDDWRTVAGPGAGAGRGALPPTGIIGDAFATGELVAGPDGGFATGELAAGPDGGFGSRGGATAGRGTAVDPPARERDAATAGGAGTGGRGPTTEVAGVAGTARGLGTAPPACSPVDAAEGALGGVVPTSKMLAVRVAATSAGFTGGRSSSSHPESRSSTPASGLSLSLMNAEIPCTAARPEKHPGLSAVRRHPPGIRRPPAPPPSPLSQSARETHSPCDHWLRKRSPFVEAPPCAPREEC
jgi:hypothetical protein